MTKTLTIKNNVSRSYSNSRNTYQAIELYFTEKPSKDFLKEEIHGKLAEDGKPWKWDSEKGCWYRATSPEAIKRANEIKKAFDEKPKAKRIPKNSEEENPVPQVEEKRKPGRPKKEETAPKAEQPKKKSKWTECNPLEGYRVYKDEEGRILLVPIHLA